MNGFNIRVYGIYIDNFSRLLLSEEEDYNMRFTKFIGGGVELGEGVHDALKREFKEECNCEIEIIEHFYTTDFFIKSAFHNQQLISIYYFIKPIEPLFEFKSSINQNFKFVKLSEINQSMVTFPIDKHVINLLITKL